MLCTPLTNHSHIYNKEEKLIGEIVIKVSHLYWIEIESKLHQTRLRYQKILNKVV